MLSSFLALMRIALMTAMQYRSNFILDLISTAIQTASSIVPLLIVYQYTDSIAGWNQDEAILVLSLFFLVTAFNKCFMEPNLGEMVEAVRKGTFDLFLMKPVDAQLLASLRRFEISGIWFGISGVALLIRTLNELQNPSMVDWIAALLTFTSGLSCLYSLWLVALCSSFFFVKVDNLRVLLWTMSDTGRWPIDVFSGWLKWVLFTAVPVAVMTSVPAGCLLGRWTSGLVLVCLALGLVFLSGSRLIWRWSLRHYSSASS